MQRKETQMKAIVSVVGKDMIGILAKVAGACAEKNANVAEVSQSVLDEYFCMIMVVNIDKMICSIDELQGHIRTAVPEMVVHVMHEDIFNAMHRI